jgi:hypothetical protein
MPAFEKAPYMIIERAFPAAARQIVPYSYFHSLKPFGGVYIFMTELLHFLIVT